jgi:hypothetical protein
MEIKAAGISRTILVACVVAVFMMSGCAAQSMQSPEAEGLGNQDTLLRMPLKDPPSYRLLEDSLEFYELKIGTKFYRNDKNRYTPYASSTWKSFSISDTLNQCLYDINMKGLIAYRSLKGKYKYLIEMKIDEGPCGIQYPDPDNMAVDKVSLMEGTVITPALQESINKSLDFSSGEKFLQKVLQIPWKIRVRGQGLEKAVARIAQEIKNPMDITFGDIIFFTEYYGERNVAVYVDYGLIVYNSCFNAKVRRMNTDINYKVYRFYTGFNLVQYKVHQDVFLNEILGRPKIGGAIQ